MFCSAAIFVDIARQTEKEIFDRNKATLQTRAGLEHTARNLSSTTLLINHTEWCVCVCIYIYIYIYTHIYIIGVYDEV